MKSPARLPIWLLVILLACLSVGCRGQVPKKAVVTVETVVSTAGNDRLIRKGWVGANDPGTIYEFHSLTWQRLAGGDWVDVAIISHDDFHKGCPHRRWISAIHSIDPQAGTAVLKVAEGDAPEGSGTINYIYAWRLWDLNANLEIRTIQVCQSPHDPLTQPVGPVAATPQAP